MILILQECGALERLMPEVAALFSVPERTEYHPEGNTGEHMLLVLAVAGRMGFSLPASFGALAHDLGKGLTPREELPGHRGHDQRGDAPIQTLCERLRIPPDLRKTGQLTAREHIQIHRLPMRGGAERPETMTALMERCDVMRHPDRFEAILLACEADRRGRLGASEDSYPQGAIWREAMAAFRGVDAGAIAWACAGPEQIQERLRAARVEAVRRALGIENPEGHP
jgi:tRNA nucleotidyltransferase (CCA-adding enzyme)